ncbi:AhpA/YtjB family protein [Pseudoalteromonas denitrificans]|uniref:Membrane protein n=1 Tax=Pseudoalteromonas denitrificans DSM 6059 TaxID=1123010 RepID=A0A1I1LRQ2_9GAMM|nr:AhpA/YtjB family protein [Pseudoalteromonas denitrificans]SFC75709.1 membrane protein [Pseudoalteromonas denitrificans DSM 6059]
MKKKQLNNPLIATIYQRVSRLALTLICLFLLLNLGFNSSFHSHEILAQQTQHTARSLAQQMSYAASDAIVNNNPKQLKLIVNNMTKDPYIVSSSIFDKYGVLIIQSNNSFLYQDYMKQPNAMPGISKLSSPIIQPIFNGKKRLGFVRITYLSRAAMSKGHNYFHQLGRQIGLMLILSCILTWLTARTIKRWQVNRYTKKILKLNKD